MRELYICAECGAVVEPEDADDVCPVCGELTGWYEAKECPLCGEPIVKYDKLFGHYDTGYDYCESCGEDIDYLFSEMFKHAPEGKLKAFKEAIFARAEERDWYED